MAGTLHICTTKILNKYNTIVLAGSDSSVFFFFFFFVYFFVYHFTSVLYHLFCFISSLQNELVFIKFENIGFLLD